jgi:hypothetical protein
MTESKNKLVKYLLTSEYITLLERTILSRYSTSSNNKEKHAIAIELIRDFKADPENQIRYIK